MIQKKRRTVTKVPKADKHLTFNYTQVDQLSRYVTEQGAIVARAKTGLSQKQQRQLAKAIKHARHLAMLPFTQTL
jgi:small subunit ribosomal protein S18